MLHDFCCHLAEFPWPGSPCCNGRGSKKINERRKKNTGRHSRLTFNRKSHMTIKREDPPPAAGSPPSQQSKIHPAHNATCSIDTKLVTWPTGGMN